MYNLSYVVLTILSILKKLHFSRDLKSFQGKEKVVKNDIFIKKYFHFLA